MSNPRKKIKTIITNEYESIPKLNEPVLKNAFLNPSIIEVIGLININKRIFSGTIDNGYTIGEAYINNSTLKLTKNLKSRYLVVRADTIIPSPIPNNAIRIIKTGIMSNTIIERLILVLPI